METLISSVCFIPRGVSAEFPEKYIFNKNEYKKIHKLIDLQVKNKKKEKKNKNLEDNDLKIMSEDEEMINEYNLQNYDIDSDDDQRMGIFTNIKDLTCYESEDDPYITLKDDSSHEEKDELQILSTDYIILAAKTEDNISYLEVYVYEASESNLYVHHDIILSAPPLSLEWFGYKVFTESNDSGNFVAIGTLDTDIEIWNLDIIDPLYPAAILGNSKRKKSKKAKNKVNSEYHVDSVLSLSINKHHKNILASGSADTSIKLWDLRSCTCTNSYVYHTNKVSYIEWHPLEATLLLSGSFDYTCMMHDLRSSVPNTNKWVLESDIESVRWDLHNSFYFYACTDSGIVYLFDIRNPPNNSKNTNSIWTLEAHDGPVSAFDINSFVKGYFITGSTDKSIKLWNAYGNQGGPSMILSKNIGVGKVFSTRFSLDKETMFSLVAAGSNGIVKVWDTSTNKAITRLLKSRLTLATYKTNRGWQNLALNSIAPRLTEERAFATPKSRGVHKRTRTASIDETLRHTAWTDAVRLHQSSPVHRSYGATYAAHYTRYGTCAQTSPPRTPPRVRPPQTGEEGVDLLIYLATSPSPHTSLSARFPPHTPQNFDLADFVNITPSPSQTVWSRTPSSARKRLTFDTSNGASTSTPGAQVETMELGGELTM
ncbi:hypothetical protein PORY_001592 [Pneumocystis oryctolagi]|uniref:Uncharacterized protein n=1 Tax=Pneumocystis oryctolagi TaxID=42067 RepID=A0ACB7CEJ8_9ASCO|nr:hypothetical protein PORY_001592 [Pneumocystis oryctolagi]